jgi:hypothetical protein
LTTNSQNNSFVKDGKLYIMPTLTSDVIGRSAIFDGFTYNLTDCTGANYTSCGVVSNQTTNTVINPVMSARLTTKKSHSIRFGRVEIRAKLPRGDWLWPALWMLPRDNVYGEWPMSGEIDVCLSTYLSLWSMLTFTLRSWSLVAMHRLTPSKAGTTSAVRSTGVP